MISIKLSCYRQSGNLAKETLTPMCSPSREMHNLFTKSYYVTSLCMSYSVEVAAVSSGGGIGEYAESSVTTSK